MNIKNFIKNEFEGFSKIEVCCFFCIILFVVLLSILTKDSKLALVSAICGISYTILAGKGKIMCYFIGMAGTVCYCIIAFQNGFFGNLFLYALYYFPMEIIGIYKWKQHLKKDKNEIIKTKLTTKERIAYFAITAALSLCMAFALFQNGGTTPFMDGFTTVFSVTGQLLTVKRCIEQWYVWFFVNFASLIMWIIAYLNGSNCLATLVMWSVYLFMSVYFLVCWKKELEHQPQ